jgi:hypothetical protein
MKWLVGMLVVANAALFGYFTLSRPQPSALMPGHEVIQPEAMRILSAEQLAVLPRTSSSNAPQAVPQSACYEWGSFPAGVIPRARGILEKFGLEPHLRIDVPREALRYWVYIPPRKSLEEAQARNNELHAMGIKDTFIVQNPQWRNAISLGIFGDEALAARLAEDLQSRGVKDVVKDLRNQESGQSSFFISNVPVDVAEEIGKLRPEFPYSEFRQVNCQ